LTFLASFWLTVKTSLEKFVLRTNIRIATLESLLKQSRGGFSASI
jgi:hypothetical protein